MRPGKGVSRVDPEALAAAVKRLEASRPPSDHRSFDALVGDHPADVGVDGRSGRPPSLDPSLKSRIERVDAFSRAILAMDMEDPR